MTKPDTATTWRWIVGIFVTISLTLATAWAQNLDKRTEVLPERVRAIEERTTGIDHRLERMENKLDLLLQQRIR